MTTKQWTNAITLLLAIILIGLMVYIARLAGCGQAYRGEYQQFSQQISERKAVRRQTKDYYYVVDLSTKQYWPNEPKYADRIAKEDRVFIKDRETLDQFKGYEPGPL